MSRPKEYISISVEELTSSMEKAIESLNFYTEMGNPIEVTKKMLLLVGMGSLLALTSTNDIEAVRWAISYLDKVVDEAAPELAAEEARKKALN